MVSTLLRLSYFMNSWLIYAVIFSHKWLFVFYNVLAETKCLFRHCYPLHLSLKQIQITICFLSSKGQVENQWKSIWWSQNSRNYELWSQEPIFSNQVHHNFWASVDQLSTSFNFESFENLLRIFGISIMIKNLVNFKKIIIYFNVIIVRQEWDI